jgi:hypothetical protein
VFICLIHGKYQGNKSSNECPRCVSKSTADQDLLGKEFILRAKKIHKKRYDYGEFVFVDFMTPGWIRCRNHGRFEMSPAVHILHRAKCPKCSGSISKGEVEWLNEVERQIGRKIERNGILFIGKKSIRPDGIDRDNKICWEYLGSYWHGSPLKHDPKDMNYKAKKTFGKLYEETIKRENMIKRAGYQVIKIWDYEWEEMKNKSAQKKKSGRKKK